MTAWARAGLEVVAEPLRRGARDSSRSRGQRPPALAIVRTRDGAQPGAARGAARGSRTVLAARACRTHRGIVPRCERPPGDRAGRASDANVLVLGENGTGKGHVARCAHGYRAVRHGRIVIRVASRRGLESEPVRPRPRRIHGRRSRIGRAFELARPGDPVSRRSTVNSHEASRQTDAGIETGEFERFGSSRDAAGERPVSSRRPTPTSMKKSPPGASAGSPVPPEHDRDPDSAAARSAEDSPLLARHPSPARAALSQAADGVRSGAMRLLLEHSWPGNVRELDHGPKRAVLIASGPADRRPQDLGLRATGRAAAGRLEDMSLETWACS